MKKKRGKVAAKHVCITATIGRLRKRQDILRSSRKENTLSPSSLQVYLASGRRRIYGPWTLQRLLPRKKKENNK